MLKSLPLTPAQMVELEIALATRAARCARLLVDAVEAGQISIARDWRGDLDRVLDLASALGTSTPAAVAEETVPNLTQTLANLSN